MNTKEEIFVTIKGLFVELFEVEPDSITLKAHLYDDLDIDSIDAIDLMAKLKEITGKKVKAEDFKSVRAIGDIVDIVYQLVHE